MPTTDRLLIDRLTQLVGTPSVSSTDDHWDQSNRDVVDLLATWLADMGFKTEIQNVDASGRKANLIATLGTGPGGLVLAGHTDTVPFDEGRWESDPLALTERDNRLYGLGSTDMKGFFPVALSAVSNLQAKDLKQPLIILATADEESSMNGARKLAASGKPRSRAAIIGEPTSLRPIRMHKGIMMECVRVTGRAGHSSNPALGNSALEGMHAVISELIKYRGELAERYSNPFFTIAEPTMNLGCIHGGDSPNRICGKTDLHFDLRMVPGGDNTTVREEIRQRVQRVGENLNLKVELSSLINDVAPFEQSADSDLVRLAEKLSGYPADSVSFATEAPFLQQLGMDTIVMGPGSIDQAHQPDEYLALGQIGPGIEILRHFIRHYCL